MILSTTSSELLSKYGFSVYATFIQRLYYWTLMNVVLGWLEETTMFLVLNSESKSISVADLVCVYGGGDARWRKRICGIPAITTKVIEVIEIHVILFLTCLINFLCRTNEKSSQSLLEFRYSPFFSHILDALK